MTETIQTDMKVDQANTDQDDADRAHTDETPSAAKTEEAGGFKSDLEHFSVLANKSRNLIAISGVILLIILATQVFF